MNKYKKIIKITVCGAIIILISNCTGYKFTPSIPSGVQSIALMPIVNQTTEAGLELSLTKAMRSTIQSDGRLILTEPTSADAIINVTITNYKNSPISYQTESRSITPNYYKQRITASASMIKSSSGKIISETSNYGESAFSFESDLSASKRGAFAQAAEELARFLYTDLIEQW